MHIFNNDGSFLRDIRKPVTRKRWPYDVDVNDECAVVGYVDFTHTFNITTGELIGTANNMGGAKYVSDDCSKIYVDVGTTQVTWKVYSPTGALIRTTTERPLELGKVKEKKAAAGYQYAIQFPDKTYSFVIPWMSLNSYRQDLAGNLIIAAQTDKKDKVYKINACSRITGELQILEDRKYFKEMMGPEVIEGLEVEYGQPVIAPNGDIYTWSRTPDIYNIIKWTWRDDANIPTGPEAPTNLTASSTATGISLGWQASPQDPGCVAGYEVVRATTSGGVSTTLGTVNAGVLSYADTTAEVGVTYYYKVRAVAGSEYSSYTSEASGRRQ